MVGATGCVCDWSGSSDGVSNWPGPWDGGCDWSDGRIGSGSGVWTWTEPADGDGPWAKAVDTPAANVATLTTNVTSTPTVARPRASRASTREAGRLGFGRTIIAPPRDALVAATPGPLIWETKIGSRTGP